MKTDRRCAAARVALFVFSAMDVLCFGAGVARSQIKLGAEFQINSFTEGDQDVAAVASDGAGNFVVVWTSPHDGSGSGVFGQRFDSAGAAVGAEFQVNTYTPNYQSSPRVSQDPTGAFVVAWESVGQDGSGIGIFAQRFDSGGAPVGSEFQVNTYTVNAQSTAAVGIDPDGDFIIAWQSLGDGSSDGVFGQRYDSNGNRLGTNFQVNTYTPGPQRAPRVAVLDSGSFVVAWNGTYSRGVGQRFASTGAKIGTEITLSPDLFFGGTDGLAANPSTGDFVFAYDLVGIFAGLYTSSGAPVGSSFQVDDIPYSNFDPQAAMNTTGEFVVAWTNYDTTCSNTTGAYDGGSCGIFARGFDAFGQPLSSGFQVNSYTLQSQDGPALAWTGGDEFVAVWTTQGVDGCGEDSGSGIVARRFDSAGASLGAEYLVNEFTPSSQTLPDVAADPFGGFVVAWSGLRDGDDQGVFGRAFDSTGAALGGEFQINTATTGSELRPLVAVGPSGNFVATWTSTGSSTAPVRRFDGTGQPLGTEFTIDPYAQFYQLKIPTGIAADGGGNFVVVWDDYGDGSHSLDGEDGSLKGIFGQRFDSSGTALGSYFQVNTFTPQSEFTAKVAMRATGEFVTVWHQGDGSYSGVFGQRFSSSGSKVGAYFQINTYTPGLQQRPSIGMDAAGNFVVAWDTGDGYAGGELDGHRSSVVARRYDSSGVPVGGEFVVNTYTYSHQRRPRVAVNATGEFAIVWESNQQDGAPSCFSCPANGIFAQRYASNGAPEGTEFQVNVYTYGSQNNPRLTYDADGNLVFVYESGPDGCGDGGNTKSIAGQRFRLVPSPTRTVTPTATNTPTLTPTPVRAVCGASPAGGCANPTKAIIKMQDKGTTKKLLSKWSSGTVSPGQFGDPTASTSYRLCVYDDGALIMSPLIDSGNSWQATAKGFKFVLPGGNADGIYKVILKTGTGNAKILVKGKGPNLSVPFPAGITQSTALTAQLVKDAPSGSECWEAVFTPPNGGSDSESFKDKLP